MADFEYLREDVLKDIMRQIFNHLDQEEEMLPGVIERLIAKSWFKSKKDKDRIALFQSELEETKRAGRIYAGYDNVSVTSESQWQRKARMNVYNSIKNTLIRYCVKVHELMIMTERSFHGKSEYDRAIYEMTCDIVLEKLSILDSWRNSAERPLDKVMIRLVSSNPNHPQRPFV